MSGKTGEILEFGTESAVGAGGESAVNIAIIGATGRVGRRVLELIAERQAALRVSGLRLRVVAVANSRASLVVPEGLSTAHAAARLAEATLTPSNVLFDALTWLPRPLIVLDCTASPDIATLYPQWLAAGIDIVTPSKFGPSADRTLASAIAAAQNASGASLRDSATVGAQLPLLGTLRELHHAGDRVERIEAVLSGTLSFVLGRVQQGEALSTAVRDAVAQGYAEPNPARDLSGEDAARKLVILLRALGHDIEFADVERVPLIDAAILDAALEQDADPAHLLGQLESVEETWRARTAIADARHERWIYRASFEHSKTERGRARVAPERVAHDHPLARLAPCENALILHSTYYRAAPLQISGPGAGIDLTAAAVFADLLATVQHHRLPRAQRSLGVVILPVNVAA
jgi:homoserine dehydrogenase